MKKVLLISLLIMVSLFVWYNYTTENSNIENKDMQKDELTWVDGEVHVVIDTTEVAYTVFGTLEAETTKSQVEDMLQKSKANGSTLRVVPIDQFTATAAENIATVVVKNEYPEVDLARGILEFFEKAGGAPIGVTWNGGIAFTARDYEYAKETYQDYLTNPDDTYREDDRDADPVHPLNHFGPMLGWKD